MAEMDESRREIEIKLPFDSYEEALESVRRAGASPICERTFEDNVLFDFPDGSLKSAGKLVRVRRTAGRTVLTFKAKVAGESRHAVRDEYETEVTDFDGVCGVLAGLGLAPSYRYQKYRTGLSTDGVAVAVDETPIGCFVELEGEPEAIDRVATELGFSPDRYVLASYRELQEQRAAARGVPPGDMLL